MRLVYNLLTGEEHFYDEEMTPEQAVKVSYALENGLGTQLAVEGVEALDIEVLHGKHTVGCGDWFTRK